MRGQNSSSQGMELVCGKRNLPVKAVKLPFFIISIVSVPANRMRAQGKDLKPSMGRMMHLIARCSRSTILFKYFT